MDSAEREIYHYLKSRRPKSIPARDINRHVGSKRKYRYNHDWAQSALLRMVDRGILETDAEGATYEAHMAEADGSQVTVKLDASFKVTSIQTGR